TVTRGLHDDVLVEAEKIAQREQLFLGRVAGRVFALGRIGKFCFGAEHMAMRIDRAGRRLEFRLRWIGVEGDVTRRHRHATYSIFFSSFRPSEARAGIHNHSRTTLNTVIMDSGLAPSARPGMTARPSPARAPRSAPAARRTCRADGRAQSRRHAD